MIQKFGTPYYIAPGHKADFAPPGGPVHFYGQRLSHRIDYIDPGTDLSGNGIDVGNLSHF